MALPSNALITLAEAKEELRIDTGATSNDSWIESLIGRASDFIEGETDCPLVYDADVEAAASIVNGAAWASGAVAIGAQPTAPRALYFTPVGTLVGTVTVLGTAPDGSTVSESWDAALGAYRGSRAFSTITSITVSGASGSGTMKLGTIEPLVEYHTAQAPTLYSRVAPIFDMIEVNEDASRAHAATTAMSLGSDVIVSRGSGKLTKVKSGGMSGEGLFGAEAWVDYPEDYYFRFSHRLPTFNRSPRAIKLTYTAGYRCDPSRSTVPGDLKYAALFLTTIMYRRAERKTQDVSSQMTAVGQASVAVRNMLTEEVKNILKGYRTKSMTFESE